MDTRWRNTNRREIVRKIGSVNAPPTVVRLAVEIQGRIAGPSRPTSVLAHQDTRIRRI
ncbi:hypothetical protein PHJA_001506000 [Phtheirospermum japonicum]|uniref:Uncharacterized protein n=1 Tax=Phtheirospermum japonicum TaxID=374723 RepID=A0A830C3H6_9LAMI|nr:hypothetical protein PHJA_001506000 [Phtheirospermum japonicum]